MGNLFYRRIQPSEIKAMGYNEMKYWNSWHELMAEQDKKEAEKIKNLEKGIK